MVIKKLAAAWNRLRCSHEWQNDGWTESWDIVFGRDDPTSGRGPRWSIRRGKRQICAQCDKRKTSMVKVNTFAKRKSDEFHDGLTDITLGYPPRSRSNE